MRIIVSNKMILLAVPGWFREEIKERLTFQNPKWLENDRMGYWNGNTPEYLRHYREVRTGLMIPRGFGGQLVSLARNRKVPFRIEDRRRALSEINFHFKGTLKPFQEKAVEDVLSKDFGTLSAPTGSGKTVMALNVIAKRRQPTLIVVHTKELLYQWIDRIETFLGIPKEEIGVIGDGKKTIGEKLTVALVQTLYKCAEEIFPHIGFLIADECHRAPARTFTQAVSAFDSKYMLGLSATPWRRDRLSRLIFWFLGDVVHKVENQDLVKSGDILEADVITRGTNFRTSLDASEEYTKVLSELTEDHQRNILIASDIAKAASNGGGISLVLSDRKDHCEAFVNLLKGRFGIDAELLTGDIANGERQAIVERLNRGEAKVLVATGQLIGEGFDCKGLSTLFLTTPIKFSGRVLQYLGRVLRPAPGKEKAMVYDYVDTHVGVLKAAAKARQRAYGGDIEQVQ